MSDPETPSEDTAPEILPPRVVVEKGTATPEEIAALLVLFAAAAGGDESADAPTRGGWTRRSRAFNAGAVRGAGWGGGL